MGACFVSREHPAPKVKPSQIQVGVTYQGTSPMKRDLPPQLRKVLRIYPSLHRIKQVQILYVDWEAVGETRAMYRCMRLVSFATWAQTEATKIPEDTSVRLAEIRARLASATTRPWPPNLAGIVERNGSRGTLRNSIDIRDEDLALLEQAPYDLEYLLNRVSELEKENMNAWKQGLSMGLREANRACQEALDEIRSGPDRGVAAEANQMIGVRAVAEGLNKVLTNPPTREK